LHPALAEHLKNTVMNEDIKIPLSWNQKPSGPTTRTKLKQMQRNEFIPDKSYDLDGDGSVGTLNKLVKNRTYRIIQKRGKIIDGEDFTEVRSTYPEFPRQNAASSATILVDDMGNTRNSIYNHFTNIASLSQSPSRTFKSKTELNMYRREENIKLLNGVKAKWDEKHPPSIPNSFKQSEFLVKNPKHRHNSEIKEKLLKEARMKAGLNAVSQVFITRPIDEMMPSLKYNPHPKFDTGSSLKEANRLK
jgi:hypothetical protein